MGFIDDLRNGRLRGKAYADELTRFMALHGERLEQFDDERNGRCSLADIARLCWTLGEDGQPLPLRTAFRLLEQRGSIRTGTWEKMNMKYKLPPIKEILEKHKPHET